MTESIKAKVAQPPKPMAADIFQRKNTVALARWLLGKTLARRMPDGSVRHAIITETEAYHGENDLACHASKGRTPRTDVMYRAGGIWYVYLCYGMHEMLNLVTGPEGFPAAILIRGVRGISGPGRLTKTLAITRLQNGSSACDPVTGLWLEDAPGSLRVSKKQILVTPRVGVTYAGPVWTEKPWRFVLHANRVNEIPARREA